MLSLSLRSKWSLPIIAVLIVCGAASNASAQTPHGATLAWTNSVTVDVKATNVYRCTGTAAICGTAPSASYTKVATVAVSASGYVDSSANANGPTPGTQVVYAITAQCPLSGTCTGESAALSLGVVTIPFSPSPATGGSVTTF